MKLVPITSKTLQSNNCKVCRQCHRSKPIRFFISKNNMGICIICKSCRESQMKRYYEKKKKMQEALDKSLDEKAQTISPTCAVSVSPLLSPQFSSSQCNSSGLPNSFDFSNSQNISQKNSVMNSPSFPVPYAKWIIVNPAYPIHCVDSVQTAKLVYYSSCKKGYSVNSISTKKEMVIKDMSASCPNTVQSI